jgi:eukaryotic-like serine/threonine-protein kinase
MKSFFHFVLLALILLIVALVSALTAMRFAIHGQETKIPDLIGKTPTEARRLAEGSGFDLLVERQYYSPTMPEGKILSQVPAAGMRIRRGWQLRVAVSLGPQRVEIPNVIGESERAAEINIRRRGLDVSAVSQIVVPGAIPDQVLAQTPAPNASGVSAPKISLLTAQPAPPQAYVMPSFIRQTLGNATSTLKAAGFQLGNVSSATSPAGQPSSTSIIVSQTPAPGSKLTAGAGISFQVQ